MMECLCVMCHSALEKRGGGPGPAPATCSDTCRSALRVWRKTGNLNPRCADTRLLHAHRRELDAAWCAIGALVVRTNRLL